MDALESRHILRKAGAGRLRVLQDACFHHEQKVWSGYGPGLGPGGSDRAGPAEPS